MASNFDRALLIELRYEGGFVNDPKDPGGATNLGITLGTARAYNLDADHDGHVDVRDVKLLTPAIVGPVYKAGYWDKIGADQLPAGLDLLAFDCAINQGVSAAKLLLSQASHDADVLDTFRALREARYRANVHFDHFGRGWMNRLSAVTSIARQWALQAA